MARKQVIQNYFNQKQAARYLGMGVTNFVQNVKPHVKTMKVKRNVYYLKSDLDAFMLNNVERDPNNEFGTRSTTSKPCRQHIDNIINS